LTTYSANIAETDSTPNLTASGFEIDLDNPKKHRILAISRDLKRELKWGEKVVLENAGRFNGIWYVRDLMNPRFRNKIDVLINEGDKPTKLYNVILKRLE
jgi:3D (Asp-Asp-Asp) domain-containing protein